MAVEKVRLTGEKVTLLATLHGKAIDNRADHPILSDRYADDVLRHIDYDFAKLKIPKGSEISLPVRAKHLDGWTREFITEHPRATVLHLGCGLDSRVFRIDPPATVRWYDVDYPEVIDLRERLYPTRHDYTMIGSSVTDPRWLDGIPPDQPVVVVAEGLIQYLSKADAFSLFRRITERFPSGQLMFDAYSTLMVQFAGLLPAAKAMGVKLSWGIDDPSEIERRIPRLELISDASFFASFLTMPELVARFSRPRAAMLRFMGHLGFVKRAVRHVRYRF